MKVTIAAWNSQELVCFVVSNLILMKPRHEKNILRCLMCFLCGGVGCCCKSYSKYSTYMNLHFPLREAERSTRLSTGVSVTGGWGSHADGSFALSSEQAPWVFAAFGAFGPISLSTVPRLPQLASHLRAVTSRTSRNSRSSAGAGRGCIACKTKKKTLRQCQRTHPIWQRTCDELPPITAAEAAAFCFNMVQSKV